MTTNAAQPRNSPAIHPATRLGHVQLTVADLEREVAFYQDVLGLSAIRRGPGQASLGAGGTELLRLVERSGARRVPRTTGLYHFALLAPTREPLAQWLRRIAQTRTPIQGMVDHWTHEAIYLPDPEGNGIELAWDRPREQWVSFDEMLRRGNGPLDHRSLLNEIADASQPWTGAPAGTAIGHIHLHVANLEDADAFYHGVLGFEVMGKVPGSMEFVAAGGYHHHIGFNLWVGAGAPPAPVGSQGLDHFTIQLPSAVERDRVLDRVRAAGLAIAPTPEGALIHDPAHNGALLSAGA